MFKMIKHFAMSLAALSMTAGLLLTPAVVRADALRVVTLGADLSDAQKQTMLKYFKVNADEVRIIYVTNQDERARLGNYVPLEQIGTRTVSCAYVRPTTSGGIKVRTANLNWVTGNMIATSLSTSGVTNCEVIAACPFEVSGTGALTGVLMAYEVASGTSLDATKKEIATQEIITTANLAEEVGQDQAVNVVNSAKTEVIANNIQDADDIYNTVINIINQNGISISSEEIDHIVELLEEIAAQDYDYDEMEDTLVMINQNVAGVVDDSYDPFAEEDDDEEDDFEDDPMMDGDIDEDSIVLDLDESILGDDVVISSTDFADQNVAQVAEENESDWEIFESDGDFLLEDDTDAYDDEDDLLTVDDEEDDDLLSLDEDDDDALILDDEDEFDLLDDDDIFGEDEDDDDLDAIMVVADSEDDLDLSEWDTSFLSEAAKERFEKAELFCQGEYENNEEALQKALDSDWATTLVTLDTDTGSALTKVVLKKYLSILGNGAAYTPSASDPYVSAELNAMYDALKKIFAVDGTKQDKEAGKVLKQVSQEDADLLYEDTLSFFENLYGETALSLDDDEDLLEEDDDEGWHDLMVDEGEDILEEDEDSDLEEWD